MLALNTEQATGEPELETGAAAHIPAPTATQAQSRVDRAQRGLKSRFHQALPTVSQYTTLECISNTLGGKLMSNANWTDISLSQLFAGP